MAPLRGLAPVPRRWHGPLPVGGRLDHGLRSPRGCPMGHARFGVQPHRMEPRSGGPHSRPLGPAWMEPDSRCSDRIHFGRPRRLRDGGCGPHWREPGDAPQCDGRLVAGHRHPEGSGIGMERLRRPSPRIPSAGQFRGCSARVRLESGGRRALGPAQGGGHSGRLCALRPQPAGLGLRFQWRIRRRRGLQRRHDPSGRARNHVQLDQRRPAPRRGALGGRADLHLHRWPIHLGLRQRL